MFALIAGGCPRATTSISWPLGKKKKSFLNWLNGECKKKNPTRCSLVKLTLSENTEEAERSLSKCWVKFICAQGFIYVQGNTFAREKKKDVACKTRKREMGAE